MSTPRPLSVGAKVKPVRDNVQALFSERGAVFVHANETFTIVALGDGSAIFMHPDHEKLVMVKVEDLEHAEP
ncbi:MAG: hypothetical protein V4662_17870 [Verrucomicrobiota bacterium]